MHIPTHSSLHTHTHTHPPLHAHRFTPQERESFGRNYLGNGFVDTFRRQHPDLVGYTYFSRRFPQLRTQNRGWRLDYWLVSESLYPAVHDCFHLRSVMGSDHVPLGLVVKMDV